MCLCAERDTAGKAGRDAMKNRMRRLSRHLPWLLFLAAMDAVWALLLWLSEAGAFFVMAPLILLLTALAAAGLVLALDHREKKKEQAFEEFLDHPDKWQEEHLIRAAGMAQSDSIRKLAGALRAWQDTCRRADCEAEEYEEYVEAWAHEIKTPLSLLTMILDNQREEIPPAVYFKLDYIRSQIQEQIGQMLYYARLKSPHKCYLFEFVDLGACVEEILEDYRILLEEKQFLVRVNFSCAQVFTDRRGIVFLISQIVSNAVKYSSERPELTFVLEQTQKEDRLKIRDNGVGVKACDLPCLFQKGFTGDSDDRSSKGTGMGLYLSKKMADDLRIGLEIWSERGKGFEASLIFPKIQKDK